MYATLLAIACWHGPAAAAGQCSEESFRHDAAATLEACDVVLQGKPKADARLQATIMRGRALHRLGKLDEAIAAYDQALGLGPKEPEPYVRRGWTAYDKGDLPRVLELAEQALNLKPNHAPAYDLAGATMGRLGAHRNAMDAYDKAIELEPNDPGYRYHRFQLLESTRRDREALDELNRILSLPTATIDRPHDVSYFGRRVSFRAAVLLQKGRLLDHMARHGEAAQAFDQAIAVAPSSLAYALRASHLVGRSSPIASIESDVRHAFELDPTYWLPHYAQGNAYRNLGRWQDAAAAFQRAAELNPTYGELHWRRALALRSLGQLDEAATIAFRAVESDPAFLHDKMAALVKRGYLEPPGPNSSLEDAIRDAVRACMIDDRCS